MTVVPEDVISTRDRISGWVLKGSEVLNAIACRRFGVLENDTFNSFRQSEDEQPSAVYPLHARCEVSGLEQRDILVRAKGKSTFVALVAGKYEKIDGFQFSIVWPGQTASRSSKNVRLVLGFESETTAARWQTAFLQSIDRLAMIMQETDISSPPLPMAVDSPEHPSRRQASKSASEDADGPSAVFKSDSERPNKASETVANHTSFHDVDEEICRSTSFNSSAASGQLSADPGAGSSLRTRQYGFWSPWKLVNGLAIYKEDDPTDGVEAFMVSCIVRSTPTACFNALMVSNKDRWAVSNGFLDMDVIHKIDEHVDVVHSRIVSSGWMASVLAPREILLDRNWRKEEEDGTYIVVMKSSDRFLTEDANMQHQQETIGHYLWEPVRAHVLASVFTIAPLQEKYFKNASESPEALLTMVLKIDLGGALSPSHMLGPFTNLLGIREAWTESILMTVVALKDRVEQSRFVSLPFSSEPGPLPPETSLHDGASSSLCRWTETDQKDLSGLPSVDRNLGEEIAGNAPIPLGMDATTPPELRRTGTCDPAYWTCPGSAGYRVRGRNYLSDKKKISAAEPMFRLLSVDLVKLDQPTRHIGQYLTSVRNSPSTFSFVVQIMVPGPPHLALVIMWGSRDECFGLDSASMSLDDTDASIGTEHELPPFDLALMRFFTGDDETRNSSFKLIPHVINGSFIIRQSVGSTPVLLGKKLKQYYFKTARYIEVDIDVGSSYTAATVVNMVSGVTRTLVVDLAVVLEGKTQQELPESLLGTVRLDHLDLNTAVYLNTNEDEDKGSGEEPGISD